MNETKRFPLIFETLTELAPEIRMTNTDPMPALPKLSNVLAGYPPLPREALFLGIAEDGLPVLLNLMDPVPGAVLIAGDPRSGKTRLLQLIAQALDYGHDSDQIRYAVLTDRTQEWERFEQSKSCEGILSFHQPLTTNYLASLVDWAHSNKLQQEVVLLLVDGLEAAVEDEGLHQAFRWLLLRGSTRRIWPIVTLNAAQAGKMREWLPSFRTRLCGHISNDDAAQVLSGSADTSFTDVIGGAQFAMREGRDWLPFWLPNLE